MDIHAKNGTRVKYIGADQDQINWGGCDDPSEVLSIDGEYLVDHIEVHSWHTKVSLQGIAGEFPSVAFEDI